MNTKKEENLSSTSKLNKSAINDDKCTEIINSQNKTEKEVGNYNKENEGKDKLFKNESGEIENKIIEENKDINVINENKSDSSKNNNTIHRERVIIEKKIININ